MPHDREAQDDRGDGPRARLRIHRDDDQQNCGKDPDSRAGQKIAPGPRNEDRLALLRAQRADVLRYDDFQIAGSGIQRYSPRVRAGEPSAILEFAALDDVTAGILDRELW